MNLLEKFAAVEVKADNRISERDRLFCQKHQDAFDRSRISLNQIAELMISAGQEQKEIFSSDEFHNPYLTGDGFNCDADRVYSVAEKRNGKFISYITNYFERTYDVKLDVQQIVEHLIPEEPKEPQHPYGFRDMTDEEQEAYLTLLNAHKKKLAEYHQLLRDLPLRYEQVIDEIFAQLGGYSFQERAMNEFYSRTWSCCHRRDWHDDTEKEEFEIKNDTLRLTGYWCSCDDGWSWGPEWKPSDALKTLLDAVAYFSTGILGHGAIMFPELFRYSTKQNVFDSFVGKVKSVKLFKNGRIDIKFKDAATVQEFVETCLRIQGRGEK